VSSFRRASAASAASALAVLTQLWRLQGVTVAVMVGTSSIVATQK
jgi:hypothetical protein